MADFDIRPYEKHLHDVKDKINEIKGIPKEAQKKEENAIFNLIKRIGNFISELRSTTLERANATHTQVTEMQQEIRAQSTTLDKIRANADPKVQAQIQLTQNQLEQIINGLDKFKTEISSQRFIMSINKDNKQNYSKAKSELQKIVRSYNEFKEEYDKQKIGDSDLTNRIVDIYGKHFAENIENVPISEQKTYMFAFQELKLRQAGLPEKVQEINSLEKRVTSAINNSKTTQALEKALKEEIVNTIKTQLKVGDDSLFLDERFINQLIEKIKNNPDIKSFLDETIKQAAIIPNTAERNKFIAESLKQRSNDFGKMITAEGKKLMLGMVNNFHEKQTARLKAELAQYPSQFMKSERHNIDENHGDLALLNRRAGRILESLDDLKNSETDLKSLVAEWSDTKIHEKVGFAVRDALTEDYAPLQRAFDEALKANGVSSFIEVPDRYNHVLYGASNRSILDILDAKDPATAIALMSRIQVLQSPENGAAFLQSEAAKIAQKRLPNSFDKFKETVINNCKDLSDIKDDNNKIAFLRFVLEDAQRKFGEPSFAIPDFSNKTVAEALQAIRSIPMPGYKDMDPQAAGALNKRIQEYQNANSLIYTSRISELKNEFRLQLITTNFDGKITTAKDTLDYFFKESLLNDAEKEKLRFEFETDMRVVNDFKNSENKGPSAIKTMEETFEKWKFPQKVIAAALPKIVKERINDMISVTNKLLDDAKITDPEIRKAVLDSAQLQQKQLGRRIDDAKDTEYQKALLQDVHQFNPEKLVVGSAQKQLQERQAQFKADVEHMKNKIASEYQLTPDEVRAFEADLAERVYAPLERFAAEWETLTPKDVQRKIEEFAQFVSNNNKWEQLIQVKGPELLSKKINEGYLTATRPQLNKDINVIKDLYKHFNLAMPNEISNLDGKIKEAKTPQDMQAIRQTLKEWNNAKVNLIKTGLKNKLLSSQAPSEQAVIDRLPILKGLLANNPKIITFKETFQAYLERNRLWQAQIESAKKLEDLSKINDILNKEVLPKKPSTAEPLPLHAPAAKQAYQELTKVLAREALPELQNHLQRLRDETLKNFSDKLKDVDATQRNAFLEELKTNLNNIITEQTKDVAKTYHENKESNPEAAAAFLDGYYTAQIGNEQEPLKVLLFNKAFELYRSKFLPVE